jgi:hypothetical protein
MSVAPVGGHQIIDPAGRICTILYTSRRNIRAVVDPLGLPTSLNWAASSFPATRPSRPLAIPAEAGLALDVADRHIGPR